MEKTVHDVNVQPVGLTAVDFFQVGFQVTEIG